MPLFALCTEMLWSITWQRFTWLDKLFLRMCCVLWCFVDNIHLFVCLFEELFCEAEFCHLTETLLYFWPLKFPNIYCQGECNKLSVGHFISLYASSYLAFMFMRSKGRYLRHCWDDYQGYTCCWKYCLADTRRLILKHVFLSHTMFCQALFVLVLWSATGLCYSSFGHSCQLNIVTLRSFVVFIIHWKGELLQIIPQKKFALCLKYKF